MLRSAARFVCTTLLFFFGSLLLALMFGACADPTTTGPAVTLDARAVTRAAHHVWVQDYADTACPPMRADCKDRPLTGTELQKISTILQQNFQNLQYAECFEIKSAAMSNWAGKTYRAFKDAPGVPPVDYHWGPYVNNGWGIVHLSESTLNNYGQLSDAIFFEAAAQAFKDRANQYQFYWWAQDWMQVCYRE